MQKIAIESCKHGALVHLVDSDDHHTVCGEFLLDSSASQYPTDARVTCDQCHHIIFQNGLMGSILKRLF